MDRLVVDAFQFYNELDLLEIRLNTLDSLVDFFIISEAPVMFSGLEKPLFFNEHKEEDRFEKFKHKIIHQIILDTPDEYTKLSTDISTNFLHENVLRKVIAHSHYPKSHAPYGRDSYQKECLIRSMGFLDAYDIVIIGDADEIPNPYSLKYIIDTFDENQVYNLRQKMFNYFLDIQKINCSEEVWLGNMILSYKNFITKSMCEMKVRRDGIFVDDGGWHFSFMGGYDGVLIKMISGNESQLYTEQNKKAIDSNRLNCLSLDHDMFNRPCNYTHLPISYETHPTYLVENKNKFKELLYE